MSRLTIITDRALELASHAGDSLKQVAPHAGKWLQTGAAIGAVKAGSNAAGKFVRRNPATVAASVAAVAGIGLVVWAVYRKRKRGQANAPIEGRSRRVTVRKATSTGQARARKTVDAVEEAQ